ncbi:hypothetical protein F2P81_006124 [Scophthalmus maximus]|uniref:Uncharacterized protein n=1 Tax=Scophthalmus maximus TaxID=52904 RepID=A0A6A4TKN0_SCOMX|nr:hypothetical protein F2P81_006124 [Scophthalmus maximus]
MFLKNFSFFKGQEVIYGQLSDGICAVPERNRILHMDLDSLSSLNVALPSDIVGPYVKIKNPLWSDFQSERRFRRMFVDECDVQAYSTDLLGCLFVFGILTSRP